MPEVHWFFASQRSGPLNNGGTLLIREVALPERNGQAVLSVPLV